MSEQPDLGAILRVLTDNVGTTIHHYGKGACSPQEFAERATCICDMITVSNMYKARFPWSVF